MISISNKKILALLISVSLITGLASASYYYSGSGTITQDTGFAVPHYDSQEEMLTELVAPFLFLTILLHFLMLRVLNFVLGSSDDYPTGHYPHGIPTVDDRPNVQRYSLLMSVAITAMIVPTPFWGYIRFAAGSIGVLGATLLGLIFLYGAYSVLAKL